MRHNPERLAWAVLLVSFCVWLGLVVSAPLGGRWFVFNARTRQNVALEVQRGPLRVTLAGRGEPVAIDALRDEIPEGTVVATDATAGRLVTQLEHSEDGPVISSVQLYDNTEVVLRSARTPRFPVSRLPHGVDLEVRKGRTRINVVESQDRPTVVTVHTPHGEIELTAGSYEVKVNGVATEVIVRNGQANVTNGSRNQVSLVEAQRTLIDNEGVEGPYPAERNLLVNGDFRQPLGVGWEPYTRGVAQESASGVEITDWEGQPAARFFRNGVGHAEVGIRQTINYDVRDFTSLLLHLSVQVRSQSLPGCGSAGSECPIIVRIDYKDVHGTDREWYHGFYSADQAPNDWLPPWHEQIPFLTWFTSDLGNLVEAFEEPPALIKTVTIYASGHSFDALVTEVELLAQE